MSSYGAVLDGNGLSLGILGYLGTSYTTAQQHRAGNGAYTAGLGRGGTRPEEEEEGPMYRSTGVCKAKTNCTTH